MNLNYFTLLPKSDLLSMARIWKVMDEKERDYFIDQAALIIAVLGEEEGKRVLNEAVKRLLDDGTKNLADLSLYVDESLIKDEKKARELLLYLEEYRREKKLPSTPRRSFFEN